MNVEKLRSIVDMIENLEPGQFDMGTWCNTRDKCGTVACLAGWTLLAEGENPTRLALEIENEEFDGDVTTVDWRIPLTAAAVLGLNRDQAERLFFTHCWPDGFDGDNCSLETLRERVEHFIATDGAE